MLSQLTNSNGEKRLAEWVDHLAEILIILWHTVPSNDMVKCLLMNCKYCNIEQEHCWKLIVLLSNTVFDESLMTGSRAKVQSKDQTQSDSITQPLFSRVFTAFFQGFSRVLFSSHVFRSGSYKYLGGATDSRGHVPAHMLPTNIWLFSPGRQRAVNLKRLPPSLLLLSSQ